MIKKHKRDPTALLRKGWRLQPPNKRRSPRNPHAQRERPQERQLRAEAQIQALPWHVLTGRSETVWNRVRGS